MYFVVRSGRPLIGCYLRSMERDEAIRQARLILDEEEISPTLNYRYDSDEWPEEFKWDIAVRQQVYTPRNVGPLALVRMRSRHPREVFENPNRWKFESTNYGLIMSLYGQLSEGDKAFFLGGLLNVYSRREVAAKRHAEGNYFAWNGRQSALPLLAEFSVRNQQLALLIAVVSIVKFPNANLINMLTQLQEMISLNFNLFSEQELRGMPAAIRELRNMAECQTWSSKRPRLGGPEIKNEHFRPGFSAEGRAIVDGVDAFLEQCRKAQYFYIKGALLHRRNPEVEADNAAVVGYLDKLGFDAAMVQSLNVAEQLYRDSASGFDLKNCLGIIRSFFEHLHRSAGLAVAKTMGVSIVDEWDPVLTFLRNKGFLSPQQDKFARGIYALLSDEGVHPLMAEREFARVLRNVVIEYGLMFLTILEKKGISLSVSGP